jgi:hypothetical protein
MRAFEISDHLTSYNDVEKTKNIKILPLATINPPRTKTSSNVKVPSVFATICVLPSAAINQKRDRAIWWMLKNANNWRKNLQKMCKLT